MSRSNADIAAVFEEVAELLEWQQANAFRVRAYRNAARTIASWPEAMADLIARDGRLDELPTIGRDLAGKIGEIVRRGSCDLLDRLRSSSPPGITDLLHISGLGPRRVHALYHELGIHTPTQLLDAAREARIRSLPGFGPRIEQRLAEAAAGYLERSRRWPLARVAPIVDALQTWLRTAPGVARVVMAGSFRRRRETVGDLDILIAAQPGPALTRYLTGFEQVDSILSRGPSRTSVVLHGGLQVDFRVVAATEFGAALVYFTGSRAHTIALRRIARSRKLKINEYGVYRGRKRIAGDTEASVYASIGLPWIPPELRENRGEIEAARDGTLPKLVQRRDLRGDLHAHTQASDGRESLEQMAQAAKAAGLKYLAITDHSRRLAIANGLDPGRLAAQIDAIDQLNEKLSGIVLLKGIEVDILPDGRLDLPDALLARLDLVVGAVHSDLELSRARQTTRILRAMDRPNFSILAHPNGRLFGSRGPCQLDMDLIIDHARERGCFLELDSQPDRLDMFDTQCRRAREAGVMVAISSDAHHGSDLRWLELGVDQARRGWLQAGDVLNALPLGQLRRMLARTMTQARK